MISVYPAFYKDFRCKADRCVHSCCMQNWDIEIDEATAMKYLVMTGELGETIRASMTDTKGNRRFIMKDGRCPLLQEDGLCRIIMETGEENLCDICAMHPRFFVENGNFELAGVGLACEESVELLLSNSTPLLFMEDRAPSLFDFPTLLSAMGCSLPEEALSYTPTINETYCRTILHALSQTEPVDEAWTKRLSSLSGSFTSMLKKAHAYLSEAGVPHFKSSVAGGEVELLLIEVVVRDMGLAVNAHHGAVGVYHRDAVVKHVAVLLVKAYRKHHGKLLRHRLESPYSRVFLQRQC